MSNTSITLQLSPGSMGVCAQALDLFPGRVDPGSWLTPVWVRDLTEEEAVIAAELFGELGLSVERVSPR